MGTFKSAEEAREYFKGDRFATLNGMELIDLTDEMSLCSMALGEGHKNANGGIMGGVIFTLADLAFAALANQIHLPTVAQQVSINYLNAPRGESLSAKASCLKNGRTTSVITVDVTDSLGRHIARFTGTGFKLPQGSSGSDN